MDLKLVIFLFHIFLIDVIFVSTETQSKTTASCGSPGIPGMPGVPGNPGGIGSPGTVGAKGEPGVPGNRGGNGSPGKVGAKGEPGAKGEQGVAGHPGKYGMPGSAGSVGEKGEPGAPGNSGREGIPGFRGPAGVKGEPGAPGNPGRKGIPGLRGPAGVKGEPGEGLMSDWKQCVWKRGYGKDTGLIQECIFNKKYDNTSLRVFYAGNLRSDGSNSCNRWYFTFGGSECSKPATIEIVLYDSENISPHRHRHIEGYCNQVPKGQVRVGFWIGKCEYFRTGNGYTSWKSVSRIVIEEVSPPQA